MRIGRILVSAALLAAAPAAWSLASHRGGTPRRPGRAGHVAARRLRSPKVAATFPAGGPTPHFVGVDYRLRRLFVSHLSQGTLTVMTTSGVPIKTIALGGVVHTVVVDQATQTVYVSDIARGLVDVINARTLALEARISVGGNPHGLAVSQSKHQLFVSNIGTNAVDVVSTRSNTVVATVPVGPNPWGVGFDRRTNTIYSANTGVALDGATNPAGDTITAINATTDTVEATIYVGSHPWWVQPDPQNGQIYAGLAGANAVAVVKHGRLAMDIPAGVSPHGLGLDPRMHELLVNDSGSNQVTVIDTKSDTVVATLPTGTQPQGVGIDLKSKTAYIANQGSATISKVSLK